MRSSRLQRMFRYGAAIVLWAALPFAIAEPVPEYELKAAVVYNFALFTEWPSEQSGTFNICLRQGSALRPPLGAFTERAVRGRRIAIHPLASPDGVRDCQLLYLDSADRDQWPLLKRAMDGASVLTVSEDVDIGRDGSVIAIGIDNNRVVFDVDTRAARQARLLISSRLLRLARKVQ